MALSSKAGDSGGGSGIAAQLSTAASGAGYPVSGVVGGDGGIGDGCGCGGIAGPLAAASLHSGGRATGLDRGQACRASDGHSLSALRSPLPTRRGLLPVPGCSDGRTGWDIMGEVARRPLRPPPGGAARSRST